MNDCIAIPQDSLTSLCRKLAVLSGARNASTPHYDVFQQNFPTFYSRFVLKSAYDPAILDALLKDAVEHEGPLFVGLTSELVGAQWNDELERHGFMKLADQAGMLIDLDGYTPAEADSHVVRIGADAIKEWCATAETAFGKPSERSAMKYLIQDEGCCFYAYMEGSRIVGTLLGYAEDGNYGIHEVGTLSECRCRGIGSALVHTALSAAKATGNTVASLQASKLGAPIYKRCGMRVVSSLSTWMLPH